MFEKGCVADRGRLETEGVGKVKCLAFSYGVSISQVHQLGLYSPINYVGLDPPPGHENHMAKQFPLLSASEEVEELDWWVRPTGVCLK